MARRGKTRSPERAKGTAEPVESIAGLSAINLSPLAGVVNMILAFSLSSPTIPFCY